MYVEPRKKNFILLIYNRGHASLNGQKLTVSNLCTGLDQYLIPTMEHLRHYPHGIIRNSPLLVATMRDGDWIVSGGDNGFARIFDSNSGQFLHRLEHGSAKDVVQVVAVCINCLSIC